MVSIRRASQWLNSTLLACVVLTSGCSLVHEPEWPTPIASAEISRTFTREQLVADLDSCFASLERIHPALYSRVTREQVALARDRALVGIDGSVPRSVFAPRFAEFLATFADGHTTGGFPNEEFRHYAQTGGRFLPFDLEEDNGIYRANPVYEAVHDLAAGDRILEIGGDSIEQVIADLESRKSGPARWKREGATNSFRSSFWFAGKDPVVEVTWEKPDGRRVTRWLQGVIWHDRASSGGVNYEFRTLPGNVGYIDFRHMVEREDWREFLEINFRRVRDEKMTGVIVDLRNNGGGDSQLGDDLLDYVTSKPYRMMARKEWRASDEYRTFFKTRLSAAIRWLPLQWVHPMGRRLYGAETGAIVVFESELESTRPDDEVPLRFRGPVVFLIGPRTFSSALMLADAVATYDLATVMGEETSECPTAFGEIMGLALPNTKLIYQVSSARFVRASGDESDLGGVRPDIEVKQDVGDLGRGIDTALERARVRIVEQVKNGTTRIQSDP